MNRFAAALLFGVIVGAAPEARADSKAKGTFFLVELQTGLQEAPYQAGTPGLTYGLSAGTTFKLNVLPVRWYVLGTVASRNGAITGSLDGLPYQVDRRDLDIYVAQRLVLPVHPKIRVFVEGGVGQRQSTQTIHRRNSDVLVQTDNKLLVVVAAGIQARLSKTFSVGLRGELTPRLGADRLAAVADIASTPNRMSLAGQLGVHF